MSASQNQPHEFSIYPVAGVSGFGQIKPGGGFAPSQTMQAQSSDTMYQFICPRCGATPVVDEAVRRDMLTVGCYICETPVSEANFRQL